MLILSLQRHLAVAREQLRHTADFLQLGDPWLYYYYLSWASPPYFPKRLFFQITCLIIAYCSGLGNKQEIFEAVLNALQNGDEDRKHEVGQVANLQGLGYE